MRLNPKKDVTTWGGLGCPESNGPKLQAGYRLRQMGRLFAEQFFYGSGAVMPFVKSLSKPNNIFKGFSARYNPSRPRVGTIG